MVWQPAFVIGDAAIHSRYIEACLREQAREIITELPDMPIARHDFLSGLPRACQPPRLRDGDDTHTADAQNTMQLAYCRSGIVDVFDHVAGDDYVGTRIRQRDLGGIGLHVGMFEPVDNQVAHLRLSSEEAAGTCCSSDIDYGEIAGAKFDAVNQQRYQHTRARIRTALQAILVGPKTRNGDRRRITEARARPAADHTPSVGMPREALAHAQAGVQQTGTHRIKERTRLSQYPRR